MSSLLFFFSWLSTTFGYSASLLKWLVFPITSYFIALLFHVLLQLMTCKTVEIVPALLGSIFLPGFVYIGLFLSSFGFVRSPIEIAVPLKYRLEYGPIIATVFYVFWTVMFGEALGAGYSLACAS